MCSLSALNDCLRNRSAVGDSARISSAHARTSARSSPSGTTLLTSPQRSAVRGVVLAAAGTRSRGRASRRPRARDTRVPKPASNEPTRGPFWPKRACSAAIVRSAQDVQHVPAPDRDPVDRGDDRLGDRADHPVQLLDLEQAVVRGSVIAGLCALLLVAARRRTPCRPAPVRTDHADVRVRPRQLEAVDQLVDGLRRGRRCSARAGRS